MSNVNCIYACKQRQMSSDERIEFIPCKREMNTGMRYKYIKRSLDKCGWRKEKGEKKHVTMKGSPRTARIPHRTKNLTSSLNLLDRITK